jgi:light-regulated signal transduction histidine kinase (bacteriophytochrome)
VSENLEQEELAYIISHDLQEPIRMIGSYVRLLERKYEDVLDDDAKEYIKYAVNGANRLKLMLDDLLKYSRLRPESTRKVPVRIDEVIGKSIWELKKKYGDSHFEIIFDASLLPEINADENQIIQLFSNIFDNALKFNGNINKKIQLNFRRNQDSIEISVSDNGIGMDSQYLEKIFRIFKKLHNHSDYEGSGIGLAICRKIVDLHNGKIWIQSEPGAGTKVYIILPF